MSEHWLRRAPWAAKTTVLFAAIFVSIVAVTLFFGHPIGSVVNDEVLRYFAIMWAIFTAPYYIGWTIWKIAQRGRGSP